VTRRMTVLAIVALVLAVTRGPAWAEAMALKLLPNYSRATFKSDAPLETFVGNTAADGIAGSLTVDPERPQTAAGSIRVDMNLVRTGIDKRDADMRAKSFLDTEVEANRWVTYDIKSVEIAGPLEPGKAVPAKVRGVLTVKQRPIERIAETTVTWIKLTLVQLESQKRFGFTADNIKVRARFATTFTDHGMQVPQLLIFKVSNEIQLETDLTFARQ
jgi:polyisoprenoid-binding protein YceI